MMNGDTMASEVESMLRHFRNAFFHCLRDAEENRLKETTATILIQSYYRGFLLRKRLSRIQVAAIVVQSGWRGYKGREEFRQRKAEMQKALRETYFAKMATCIQSCWRGYSSRKYIHDFYARKQYIQRILQTNKELREVLREAEFQARKHKEQEAQERQDQLFKKEMLRLHHMTSTESTQGILHTLSLTIPTHENITMSEANIRSHNKAALAKELVKRRVQPRERRYALDRSTIRVSGPLDPFKEELQLERRVSQRLVDWLHGDPFSTTSKTRLTHNESSQWIEKRNQSLTDTNTNKTDASDQFLTAWRPQEVFDNSLYS